jgi:glyoxylase-like metal-dependent hydrolase (beta-lactamase superfamily II)
VAKVKPLTDKSIKYVTLTHTHADTVGGAEKLAVARVTVIISADDREKMARDPKAEWLQAICSISQMRLVLGGKAPGATRLSIPAVRIVCTGTY